MIQEPEWTGFEKLIADILSKLLPDAKVIHNYTHTEESGETWQIDVLIEKVMGLLTYRTIIECKKHRRPVSRNILEGFPQKMKHAKAHAGIVISTSGFSKQAKSFANSENFALMEYRDAVETNWENIFGEQAWVTFTLLDKPVNWEVIVHLKNAESYNIDPRTALYQLDTASGTLIEIMSIQDFAAMQLAEQGLLVPSEAITFRLDVSEMHPFICLHGNNYLPVRHIYISGDLIFKAYTVNLKLASGHVISDSVTQEIRYQEVFSESFKFENLVKQQEGIIVSPEVYKSINS